ncbi:unnamed protein product [Caenorhabditis nigoni]
MIRTVPRTPRVVALPAGSLAKMAKNYAPFSVRNSFQVGTINSNGLEVAEGQELNAMKVFFNNKPTEFSDKVIKMEILNDKGTEIIVQNIPEPAEAKEEEQDENKDETIEKLTDKMRAVTVATKSGSSPMKPSSEASTSSEK